MEIAVQWVRTRWTKRSRGGAGAAVRNAVPVGFVLPGDGVRPVVQEVRMAEADGFLPRVASGELDGIGVRLRETDGRLLVRPPEISMFSMPRRDGRRPPAVRLGAGEWVRWQINHRLTSSSGYWAYGLDTLNLAYGPVEADVFLGSPTRFVDERAFLR